MNPSAADAAIVRTERSDDRLHASMAHLATRADELGERLLGHVFTIAPESRALFHRAAAAHGPILLRALLCLLVARPDHEAFHRQCAELARSHVQLGVQESHFDAVGAGLLRCLRELLGDAFDEQAETDWAEFYGEIAEAMLAAVEESRPDAS